MSTLTSEAEMKEQETLRFAFVMCLTLGLAPFVPEPHLWGKLRWIAGGAKGMKVVDYLDLLMHGFPWMLFFGLLLRKGWRKMRGATA